MSGAPLFPPLLTGEEVPGGQDPFSKAVAQAAIGCESGLICWHCAEDRLDAAVVFAPEEPLADAMTVVFAVTLGLGDALGALAPPE
ncbi:MAG: biotin/lipoate--protein ligase family protein, partial [Pseudomonadota bacterium]